MTALLAGLFSTKTHILKTVTHCRGWDSTPSGPSAPLAPSLGRSWNNAVCYSVIN